MGVGLGGENAIPVHQYPTKRNKFLVRERLGCVEGCSRRFWRVEVSLWSEDDAVVYTAEIGGQAKGRSINTRRMKSVAGKLVSIGSCFRSLKTNSAAFSVTVDERKIQHILWMMGEVSAKLARCDSRFCLTRAEAP